jgi:hypothetical protein
MNQLLQQFSQLGAVYGLLFSGQEILKDAILGFDGRGRKLLVLQKQNRHVIQTSLIDLNEVKECSVKKYYGGIKKGELKKRKLEHFLEKIVLHFSFFHDHPPVDVLFYRCTDNHLFEAATLEKKARNWAALLSKMQSATRRIM